MALISLDNVSKIYPKGTRPALDDINLDIERGDFVFLVGASGSGKTTLLSLLLREEEPPAARFAWPATICGASPTSSAAVPPFAGLRVPGLQAAQ